VLERIIEVLLHEKRSHISHIPRILAIRLY
jgi:hypothetical protein